MDTVSTKIRSLAEEVLDLMREDEFRCGVAESCTGGLLGAALTSIPGSSEVFEGGVVAYSDDIKRRLLNVPGYVLTEHGAVSERTARLMATGLVERIPVQVSMSLTGVAGPGGGTERTPVGRVFGALMVKDTVWVEGWRFDGDRDRVRARSVEEILTLTREQLR